MTDFGCFYTPQRFVDIVHKMINKYIINTHEYTLIDTSSGYGSFLNNLNNKFNKIKSNDIDLKAVEIAREKNDNEIIYYNKNALLNVDKKMFEIADNEKFIVVGNPPYNDITSIIKNGLKTETPCKIDADIQTRDLGISFMLSYNKLKADYVAVLHPLSYLIKQANYKLLKPFLNNYVLLDSIIINSQEFNMTSKSTGFPICINFYKRDKKGISYSEIKNKVWRTIEGEQFCFNKDIISNYLSKYPNKYKQINKDSILFYTMRDINALKRSKTFIDKPCDNAIIIDFDKLPYYCYVDIFKDYAYKIPYYLGNFDVFINNTEFEKIKDEFIKKCVSKYAFLQNKLKEYNLPPNELEIDLYFKKLLGDKYVY